VSVLACARVQQALQELRAVAERQDRLYRERVRAREARLGSALSPGDRAALALTSRTCVGPGESHTESRER
jgi:hypothetical protein